MFQMRSKDQPPKPIQTLSELNANLNALHPPINGIDSNMIGLRGLSNDIWKAAITADPTTLYDGIPRNDVLNALKPRLEAQLQTYPIPYEMDPHGVKHFPGGPPGTKFTQSAAVVNPVLEGLIGADLSRIRRYANGSNKNLYLTAAAIPQSGGQEVTIQIDYCAKPEKIVFHGYPSNPPRLSLSDTAGGPDIPM